MHLPPSGSRYYSLTVKTTPQVTVVAASFDNGLNWTNGLTDADPTHFFWLLAGPLAVGEDPSAIQITSDVQPLLKFVSTPEIEVFKAPYVSLATPDA